VRLVCSLACLLACRFDLPEVATGAGADAAVEVDAAEWSAIEVLAVPVDGSIITSASVLGAGVVYRLRASGTCYYAVGTAGDAEYFGFDTGVPQDGVSGVDIGLAVNDSVIDSVRTPRWGGYSAAHVYEIEWTGQGGAIAAQVHDGNYTNNTGMLTLQILERR